MFVVREDESQSNVKTHNLGLHFLALVSSLGYTLLFFIWKLIILTFDSCMAQSEYLALWW